MLALQRLRGPQGEGAPQVVSALCPRTKMRLRLCVPHPHRRPHHVPMRQLPQSRRKHRGLVVSPRQLPTPMQWHRHETIRSLQQLAHLWILMQPLGQQLPQLPLPLILERMNQPAQRFLKNPKPRHITIRIKPSPLAIWTGCPGNGQRHPTRRASAGPAQCIQLPLTPIAPRPVAIP